MNAVDELLRDAARTGITPTDAVVAAALDADGAVARVAARRALRAAMLEVRVLQLDGDAAGVDEGVAEVIDAATGALVCRGGRVSDTGHREEVLTVEDAVPIEWRVLLGEVLVEAERRGLGSYRPAFAAAPGREEQAAAFVGARCDFLAARLDDGGDNGPGAAA